MDDKTTQLLTTMPSLGMAKAILELLDKVIILVGQEMAHASAEIESLKEKIANLETPKPSNVAELEATLEEYKKETATETEQKKDA